MNLFNQKPTTTTVSSNIVEIKAGRSQLVGTTVTAEPRKGILYLTKNPDDQLLHWCWKTRTLGSPVEDDFILFPNDAIFVQAKDTTYVLKFTTSSNRVFYWFQEKPTGAQLKKINDALKGNFEAMPPQDEQQQLLQMLQNQGILDSEMTTDELPLGVELLTPLVANPEWRSLLFPSFDQGSMSLSQYVQGDAVQSDMAHIRIEMASDEFIEQFGLNRSDLDDDEVDVALSLLRALHDKSFGG